MKEKKKQHGNERRRNESQTNFYRMDSWFLHTWKTFENYNMNRKCWMLNVKTHIGVALDLPLAVSCCYFVHSACCPATFSRSIFRFSVPCRQTSSSNCILVNMHKHKFLGNCENTFQEWNGMEWLKCNLHFRLFPE